MRLVGLLGAALTGVLLTLAWRALTHWSTVTARLHRHASDGATTRRQAYVLLGALWSEHDDLERALVRASRERGAPPEDADPALWDRHLALESRIIALEGAHFTDAELEVLLEPETAEAARQLLVDEPESLAALRTPIHPQGSVFDEGPPMCRTCQPPGSTILLFDHFGMAHHSLECRDYRDGRPLPPLDEPPAPSPLTGRVRCVLCRPAPGDVHLVDGHGLLHRTAACSEWRRATQERRP